MDINDRVIDLENDRRVGRITAIKGDPSCFEVYWLDQAIEFIDRRYVDLVLRKVD